MALTQVPPGVLDTVAQSMGFKNKVINGDMRIDQRSNGSVFTPVTGSPYTLDRWTFGFSQSGKFSTQRNANTLTPPAGFAYYMGTTSLAATTVGASDYFTLYQAIEGLNVVDLAWGTASAVPVTLSFWVRSSIAGVHGGALSNGGYTRSYPFTFTINASNTWEYKSIVIAGDTLGTWATDNSAGLLVKFGLGVGSTFSGSAGAWASANYVSATGAITTVASTLGATFYFTGVQLEKGQTSTSFDYRPYATELQLCQRYYFKVQSTSTTDRFYNGWCSTATTFDSIVNFPVPMRIPPTALEQSGTGTDYGFTLGGTNYQCSAVPTFTGGGGTMGAYIRFTYGTGGLTVGQGGGCRAYTANAYLGWSAEL